MMITRLFSSLICLAILAQLAACAGNPVNPPIQSESAMHDALVSENSHSLLGYWLLAFDTREGSVEALPARTVGTHLNVTGILNLTMGVSVKGVPGESDPANGLFSLDVTLKHPYAAKPKLSGFDVKGILMAPGTVDVDGLKFAGLTETRLENADGYTRWWNPTEFTETGMFGYIPGKLAMGATSKLTATVNPYKLFCDRLEATDNLTLVAAEPLDSDKGRAVFTSGASNTRRYKIQFAMNPGPQVIYGYAIDCAWGPPSPNPPVHVPDDFPIQANQPEAYRVNVKTDFNALYRTSGGYAGGAAQFTIDVCDWQGQKNGDIQAEFGDIAIYCPDLFQGGMKASLISQTAIKATYQVAVYDVTPQAPGPVQFFCGAEAAGGLTYQQGPAPAPADTLTAWQVTGVDVQQPECVADSNNSTAEAVEMISGNSYVDGLCYGTDDADYYEFTVPFGDIFGGSIEVYSDLYYTKLTIFDSNGATVFASDLDGWLTIDKDSSSFTSGTYYIKIEQTYGGGVPGLYAIYPQFQFTPFTISGAAEVTPPNLSLDATWLQTDMQYLLLANNEFAWAYDATDVENPVFLSRIDIVSDGRPAWYYPYMYYYHAVTSDHTDVRKIDYTDPAHPVDSIATSLYSHPTLDCIATSIKYLFAAFTEPDNESGVLIYDHASSPGSLQLVGQIIGYADSPVMSMGLVNEPYPTVALVLYTSSGMGAFNINDPANPVLKDQIDNLGIDNTYMTTLLDFVIKTDHQTFSGNDYARVYKFDGDTFQIQDYIQLNYPPSCLEAYQDYFVVGDDSGINNFITTYDYSDPADIKSDSAQNEPSRAISIGHDSVNMYVMRKHFDPVQANIFGPIAPDFWPGNAVWRHVSYPVASFALGKYLYLGCHSDYVNQQAVIDISDGPNAQVTTSRGDPAERDLFFGNSRIFASARGGAQLYCQHPEGQYFSGQWTDNLPQDISSIAASDQYMYVSLKGSPALKVYFIADFPDTDPQELLDASCSDELTHMIAQGEALYGFTSSDMYVFDLSDPDSPVETPTPYPVSQVRDRLIFGNWLFLLMPDVLWVMDITDPLNPDFVTAAGMPYSDMSCITRLEQFLFVGSEDHHPVMVDITDPAAPVVEASPISGTPEWPIRNINASSGHLFELCDSIGVRIFELN